MDYNYLGYRFRPTEEELITYFLQRKMRGLPVPTIDTLNICAYEPWQLPERATLRDDEEWYFFGEQNKKYANSNRAERTTREGYWKVTGSDRPILDPNGKRIGLKKNLVYHIGHGPRAAGTSWVIHEYHSDQASSHKKPYVLCRLRGNLEDKLVKYGRGESSGHA